MSCNKINSAVITPVLAAGSVTSPYYFQVNISQRLCWPACADRTPVFSPTFSLESVSQVGTGQYVATVRVQGVIAYTPCDTDGCCDKTQVISQEFTIPFASTAAPTTVTITQGVAVNAISVTGCQDCSRAFVSETPVILTVA